MILLKKLIYLYAPNNVRKIAGHLEDIEESLRIRKKTPFQNVFFLPTADIRSIQKSDLIVICSGVHLNCLQLQFTI